MEAVSFKKPSGIPFVKGDPRAGRKKGSLNRVTKHRQAVVRKFTAAYEKLQSDPTTRFTTWAKENPKDFYSIAPHFLPSKYLKELKNVIKQNNNASA